ncbi:PH domain-containing protein [Gordonia jinhuaensis]|nr:PH domain-containing protein [Gordonia jinhuaensis]
MSPVDNSSNPGERSGDSPGDNSRADATSWASPKPFALALMAGGLVLLVVAIVSVDQPAGAVLIALAAVLLLGYGLAALVIRPRLSIALGGLYIRTIRGGRVYSRREIVRTRVIEQRHIGRRTPQLEFDLLDEGSELTGDPDGLPENTRLVMFSRWDLGTDPRSVAQALSDAGYPVQDTARE